MLKRLAILNVQENLLMKISNAKMNATRQKKNTLMRNIVKNHAILGNTFTYQTEHA